MQMLPGIPGLPPAGIPGLHQPRTVEAAKASRHHSYHNQAKKRDRLDMRAMEEEKGHPGVPMYSASAQMKRRTYERFNSKKIFGRGRGSTFRPWPRAMILSNRQAQFPDCRCLNIAGVASHRHVYGTL
eukprot:1157659-Pelagomonas_calceolata.AAC.10